MENGTPQPAVTLSAYARYRGCSHQAVSKAIRNGRLQRSVVMVNGAATIPDFAAADAEWLENTKGSADAAGVRERLARAELAEQKAALAKIDVQKKSGELVHAEDVVAITGEALAALRDVWEGLPDEIDQVLNVSLDDSDRIEQIVRARLARSFEKLEAVVERFS